MKTAIFRGIIENAEVNNGIPSELVVSVFMITVDGKIQVINRNPIRFFTDKEVPVNKPDCNIGDTVKITVKQTDGKPTVEEILCYTADEPQNKVSSPFAPERVISFREVLKLTQPYELKRKH